MKPRNLKYILLSIDTFVSVAISAILYFVLPTDIPNEFAKDIYAVGISILSIVFSVYFAALAIIMSSSDNEFVRFLEEKGRYTLIISIFKYSLLALFLALISSIVFYVNAAILFYTKVPHQSKNLFVIFTFIFFYGLFAALTATLDSIRYALARANYIKALGRLNPTISSDSNPDDVSNSGSFLTWLSRLFKSR